MIDIRLGAVRPQVGRCIRSERRRLLAWSPLLDQLGRRLENRCRNCDAQRFGALEVDDQLKRCRLQDRQIRGSSALEDSSRVNAGLAINEREAHSIADQTASRCQFMPVVYRRNCMTSRQRHKLLTLTIEEGIWADNE